MFSPVASTIFAYRNAEKTKNGEIGRSVVTVGQCTGVIQEISKYDNIFSASARSAMKALESFAADNKLAKVPQKSVLKWLSETILHSKHTGKAASILKGILFVCGSMGSYAAAQEVGKFYADDIMRKLGIERKVKPENKETQTNKQQKPDEKADNTENQSKDLVQKV